MRLQGGPKSNAVPNSMLGWDRQGALGRRMKKYLLIGVSAFVLGAGSMAYVSQHAQAAATPRANTYRMLGLFGDVLDTVERQYVTPVDDTKLIHAALDGMLTSLDPHSGYLDPEGF